MIVVNALQQFLVAVSLGGTESLAEHPASMPHSDADPEERMEMGITDNMVHLSIGVEHPEDLIADEPRRAMRYFAVPQTRCLVRLLSLFAGLRSVNLPYPPGP